MASVHDKLSKVRKPRVHISYDVETEGSTVKKEIPFVAGVMGDYSGNNPGEPLKALKDRKFVEIDGENFDQVLSKMTPGLNIKVDNTIKGDDTEMAVDLKFNSMDDFGPEQIALQVPALKKLLETRALLTELLSKADRSEELESLLEQILQDEGQLQQLSSELGGDEASSDEEVKESE